MEGEEISTQPLFIKHFQHHDWSQSAVQRSIKENIVIIII